jgi:hypothetical protein
MHGVNVGQRHVKRHQQNKATMMQSAFKLLSSIVSAIKQRPILFNGTTGGGLFAGSDALAQEMEQKGIAITTHDNNNDTFNSRRFLSTIAIGFVIGGFVYPSAYKRLDRLWPGKDWSTVLKKSIVEILTVGILVNTSSMISRGLLVGRDSFHVAQHTLEELPRVTRTDFMVWLPYNLVAFSVIPIYVRPTTTAFMEASWQTYISNRSHDYVLPDTGTRETQQASLMMK